MEIVVVGPCGAGKSTLVRALTARGFSARAVAQEHSIVPELWQHAGTPAALILLQAQQPTIAQRRAAEFPEWLYRQQLLRLASAQAHADLVVATDELTPDEVTRKVVAFLDSIGISAATTPPNAASEARGEQ